MNLSLKSFFILNILLSSISNYTFVSTQTYTYDNLKPQFENNFESTCSKYDFVKSHISRLSSQNSKYVVYHFHGDGQHGGLGDRLANLVTATGFSIRFNRTLIVKSNHGFQKLFRPYIPPEYLSKYPDAIKSYSYWKLTKDWLSYSNNISSIHSDYFLDCFNVDWTAFVSKSESDIKMLNTCSMINGDVNYTTISMLGNRAFLCRWYNYFNTVANKELAAAIGFPTSNQSVDLFEVAGCMLRLVMWPTDLMWHYINEAVESHFDSLKQKASMTSKYNNLIRYPKQIVTLHFRCGDAYSKIII